MIQKPLNFTTGGITFWIDSFRCQFVHQNLLDINLLFRERMFQIFWDNVCPPTSILILDVPVSSKILYMVIITRLFFCTFFFFFLWTNLPALSSQFQFYKKHLKNVKFNDFRNLHASFLAWTFLKKEFYLFLILKFVSFFFSLF